MAGVAASLLLARHHLFIPDEQAFCFLNACSFFFLETKARPSCFSWFLWWFCPSSGLGNTGFSPGVNVFHAAADEPRRFL